ncbi:hypothetical protein [Flavobacterium sp.]|uniref:hypothetical protein n=1 Tax=Flavobacterium sp. TaxID=239 RepID=UPI00374DA187
MKNPFRIKLIIFLLVFCQIIVFAQDNRIKIYESKSGDGTCAIVFPNDSEPLIVMTGKGDCTISKTMAMDDWQEMSSSTVVTTSVRESPTRASASISNEIKSPRDVATGQASGKRQHKPYQLSTLSLEALDQDSDGDGIEIYSFSWGMSNSGSSSSSMAAGKAGYNVKSNVKARTASPSSSCCSNGVCTVTVSVDKKHTKTGHVTLLK